MIVNVKNPYHQHRRVPIPRLYIVGISNRFSTPLHFSAQFFHLSRTRLRPVENSVTKERKKRYLVARGRRTNQRHLLAVVNLVPVIVVILVALEEYTRNTQFGALFNVFIVKTVFRNEVWIFGCHPVIFLHSRTVDFDPAKMCSKEQIGDLMDKIHLVRTIYLHKGRVVLNQGWVQKVNIYSRMVYMVKQYYQLVIHANNGKKIHDCLFQFFFIFQGEKLYYTKKKYFVFLIDNLHQQISNIHLFLFCFFF